MLRSNHIFRVSYRSYANRLVNEKSPYLLQHKHNPVEWWPWCEEVFEKAKEENKPIFLSVGYSTCHWCHVMERESFEDERTAAIMNSLYYNIKVDREERPDIDKTYMSFIQRLGIGGGWPMSVWLSPDKKPLWGGTYYPPRDMYGRPGFPTILERVSELYQTKRNQLEDEVEPLLHDISTKASQIIHKEGNLTKIEDIHNKCFLHLSEKFDEVNGGFNIAPKFPTPPILNFLLRYYYLYQKESSGMKAKDMVLLTLKKMANGGIHDHLAGGFHRYSVDQFWHIPHYEKMLYDQAQLTVVLLDAYQISKDEIYSNAAKGILKYVGNSLTHPEGGIFSAEDADSKDFEGKSKEGAYYVWRYSEIQQLLGEEDSKLFCSYFNIKPDGNAPPEIDPHGELAGTNTFIIREDIESLSIEFSLSVSECKEKIEKSKKILLEERNKRSKPHLDDKIITCWNGLMLSAFSKAYIVLKDKSYLESAIKLATFIKDNLMKDDILLRSYKDGPSSITGFTSDYSYLIRGLLDVYEASSNIDWIKFASKLQDKQDELFWDNDKGGYWNTTNEEKILFQTKEVYDGAEPSENSVSLQNIRRLSHLTQEDNLKERGDHLIKSFHQYLNTVPQICPEMVTNIWDKYYSLPSKEFIINGDIQSKSVQEFIDIIQRDFDPFKHIIYLNERNREYFINKHPYLKDFDIDKDAVFICENQTCKLPIFTNEDLEKAIQ